MIEQKENPGTNLPQEEPTRQWEPAHQQEPVPQDQPTPRSGPATAAGKLPAGRAKRKPKYTGKAKAAYIGYVTLTVISALIVAGYIAFSFLSAPPPVPEYTRPPVPGVSGGELGGDQPIFVHGPSSDRKEEFYTFLLVGQSEETGGSLTDTMMMAAYDVPNQALHVMSLPRDTYVSYKGYNVLLNTIYTRAGSGESGINALRSEVQKLTGIYPDYYVIVQWEAFGELVDAIGGVYYTVPRDMQYWDPTQDLRINLKKGYQLLDGNKAMQVVRFREGVGGYIDGDLGRIRTQQDFMKELVKKCLEPGTLLGNLGNYIAIFQKNVDTNLDLNAITYFVKSAVGGLDMEDVAFATLPIKEAGDGAHLLALPQAVLDMVNDGFNPYLENLELGELDIVTSIPIPSPRPTPSAEPTETPGNSPSPTPSESKAPEGTPAPSGAPFVPPVTTATPTATPRPTESTPTPHPTETPPMTPVPPTAEPTPTVEPTPTPEPTPEPGEDGPMIPG